MKRILFVDDEEKILDGLRRSLRNRRKEWEMVFAASGEEALEAMKDASFDVIVTDMRMPGMSGSEVLEHVHESSPSSVRIILSGHAESEAAMRAVPITHQFLAKPCESEMLKQVVDRSCQLEEILADESLRAVVSEVDHLPTLPRTFAQLNRTLADPEASFRDVAAVIAQDAAMSAKVMQIVNSAFFGIAQAVTSVEQAVSYLGVELVKNLALATEVFQPLEGVELPGVSPEVEQQHSLLVAEMCRSVLKGRAAKKLVDDAFLAGLLHDIGKLILAWKRSELYGGVVEAAQSAARPRRSLEKERLGVSHAEVGAYLLGVWGLPYPIVEAVANHHEPSRVAADGLDLVGALHIADALISVAWAEAEGEERGAVEGPDSQYLAAIGVTEHLPEWQQRAAELVGQVLDPTGGDESDGDD